MKKIFMMLFAVIFVSAAPSIVTASNWEALLTAPRWVQYIISFIEVFITSGIILFIMGKMSEGVAIDDFTSLLHATLIFTVSVFVMSLILHPSGLLGFVANIIKSGVALYIITRITNGFRILGAQYFVSVAIGIAVAHFLIMLLLSIIVAGIIINSPR